MDSIKDLTRHLISKSFKELMNKYPFEKITIKMITDSANIIRPTFYNHFHDKYELVEWIFEEEIINRIKEDLEKGGTDAIKITLDAFEEDLVYYKKLFEVHGQNDFNGIFEDKVTEFLYELMGDFGNKITEMGFEQKEVCRFYAMQLSSFIKFYISSDGKHNPKSLSELFNFYVTHSIVEQLF